MKKEEAVIETLASLNLDDLQVSEEEIKKVLNCEKELTLKREKKDD